MTTIVTDKETTFKSKNKIQKIYNDVSVDHYLFCKNRKPSTIQEICSHQQLQCNLWGDGKFWNLGTAVGVSYFVHEISTNFGQHMGTIINNRELRVCPYQFTIQRAVSFDKDCRDGHVSFDSTCYLFWASDFQKCMKKMCNFYFPNCTRKSN